MHQIKIFCCGLGASVASLVLDVVVELGFDSRGLNVVVELGFDSRVQNLCTHMYTYTWNIKMKYEN